MEDMKHRFLFVEVSGKLENRLFEKIMQNDFWDFWKNEIDFLKNLKSIFPNYFIYYSINYFIEKRVGSKHLVTHALACVTNACDQLFFQWNNKLNNFKK